MSRGAPPNYYAILGVSEKATSQQIRDAYKRAALKTHPDRVPVESPERASRTRKFQLVNDAYFTLSDATRRREYDAQRRIFTGGMPGSRSSGYTDPFAEADAFSDDEDASDEPTPGTGAGTKAGAGTMPEGASAQDAYSWAWNFFMGKGQGQEGAAGSSGNGGDSARSARQSNQDAQFNDVFEEMMREEGMAEDEAGQPTNRFWAMLGGASGGALGFIFANVPGALAGAVAGNRLGSVRDAKGKSVYSVFQELPQGDRARLLSQLAAKVFNHAVGI